MVELLRWQNTSLLIQYVKIYQSDGTQTGRHKMVDLQMFTISNNIKKLLIILQKYIGNY